MTPPAKQYSGPLFRLLLDKNGELYHWEIEFSGADYTGSSNLGYRASGDLELLAQPLGEFEISVHDKDRAAWTPMPLSHRKDLRKLINQVVEAAISSVMTAAPHKGSS